MFEPARFFSGAGGDRSAELRRDAALVGDLRQRLDEVVHSLPRHDGLDAWWGWARDALQSAIDTERARLAREADRLDRVRIQLLAAADEAFAGVSGDAL